MRNIIHQYKLRLTNLSQGNRSLKLARLSSRRDLDLMEASFAAGESTTDLLTKIVSGKKATLLKSLSSRDDRLNQLDLHLNRIYREVTTIFEESGAYDLFVGYPWVEGKFLEDNAARCPVMLFPVRLVRDYQRSPRWRLEVPEGEDVLLNKTFFLAYEKFQRARLSDEFWEEQPDHHPDLQSLLNYLYEFLKKEEVSVHFNQELFEFRLKAFPDYDTKFLDNFPIGKLKFQPHAVLGIFPQSDSSLLQDYETLENKASAFDLQSILAPEGKSAQENAGPRVPENKRHFVTPVDESQENALIQVKKGNSIVLHGPPGTGKSQVILNLVADALADGKRVLVCSQKRAALDVVYQRLGEVGLGRFAALIHDYRSDRKRLFQKIARQIDEIPEFRAGRVDGALAQWEYEFTLDARKIDEYNQLFDGLYQALTEVQKHGLRAHELYLMARQKLPSFALGDLAGEFNWRELQEFLLRLKELLQYPEYFRESHPWKHRIPFHTLGLERRKRMEAQISALSEDLHALQSLRAPISTLNDLTDNAPEIESGIAPLQSIRQKLQNSALKTDFTHYLQENVDRQYALRKLNSIEKIIERIREFRFLQDFPRTLLTDLFEHHKEYRQNKEKFGRLFSLKYLKARWFIRQIIIKKNEKFSDANYKIFRDEVDVLERLMKHNEDISQYQLFEDFPLTDSWEKMKVWHDRKWEAVEFAKEIKGIKTYKKLLPKVNKAGFDEKKWGESKEKLDQLNAYAAALRQKKQNWDAFLTPQQQNNLLKTVSGTGAIDADCSRLLRSFQTEFEDIRALDELISELSPKEKNCLSRLESHIESAEANPTDFLNEVRNDFFLAWIEQAETRNPVLREVSSRRMPSRQDDFREKVTDRQKKVAGLVDRKLKDRIIDAIEYNRLNNPVTYRGVSHQVNKKRRIWSIRKLVREFWEESLANLIPCWLASPESVAAVFPMEQNYFDLVIFDEASQCFVERGLPVLLRGKKAVVAGDDKQLRPLDLYRVQVDEAEDAFFENEIALEVESILDLAKTSLYDSYLSWHYRSQEEELINFSNHAFYKGKLNVIPPAHHTLDGPPIVWQEVSGTWIRSRNREEASAVVALVEKLITEPDPPSIGVVTFNYHQQEAIKDAFDQRLSALMEAGDSEKLAALLKILEDDDLPENGSIEQGESRNLFVKNIENVQGDERDIIIFSVGYAPDAQGKVSGRFGLLNLEGGENRLNVAITRARKRIYVLCSFNPEVLQVADAAHAGPKLFKKYLMYARSIGRGEKVIAENILSELSEGTMEMQDAGIETAGTLAQRLRKQLEASGLEIAENIGDTNFKVDLAVCDPQRPGEYLLGIECEGPVYFSGRSAKEREVYRHSLLIRRGWKLHRVWARNYFLDPEKEIEKIISLAQKIAEERA